VGAVSVLLVKVCVPAVVATSDATFAAVTFKFVIFAVVTAFAAMAAVSTASSASSEAVIALAAISPASNVSALTPAPGILKLPFVVFTYIYVFGLVSFPSFSFSISTNACLYPSA